MAGLSARIRHRVTIQDFTITTDAGGGQVKTWADVCTVWAGVEPLRGYERLQADQLESGVTHRVVLRDYVMLNARMRFVFGDRKLNIRSIIRASERSRTALEVMCEETQPDQEVSA